MAYGFRNMVTGITDGQMRAMASPGRVTASLDGSRRRFLKTRDRDQDQEPRNGERGTTGLSQPKKSKRTCMRIGILDGFQTPKYIPGGKISKKDQKGTKKGERNEGNSGWKQRLNIPPELAKNEGEGSLKRGHSRRRGKASGGREREREKQKGEVRVNKRERRRD